MHDRRKGVGWVDGGGNGQRRANIHEFLSYRYYANTNKHPKLLRAHTEQRERTKKNLERKMRKLSKPNARENTRNALNDNAKKPIESPLFVSFLPRLSRRFLSPPRSTRETPPNLVPSCSRGHYQCSYLCLAWRGRKCPLVPSRRLPRQQRRQRRRPRQPRPQQALGRYRRWRGWREQRGQQP